MTNGHGPRLLGASDAPAMAAVHARCFDKSWSALDMSVHAGRDLCLGLFVDGELCSFAVLRLSDADAEVLTVATRPDGRGRGLAGLILEEAANRLRATGLRHIFLEVAEDNIPARALYDRLGFTPIGRRPAYYARPGGRMAALTYDLPLETPYPASLDADPGRG
ncbi:GNAT family N-acetyltransferase [uncultured Algimonas sp.]|uniref:GNAT family N-acetyltransferase n=1 Tax=uncultured Algimonas sp. TaxID=1547920 RepID=UPI00261D1EC6|nr:GNAT family N-acetyltransferase [uncultured Algimonas sp.]